MKKLTPIALLFLGANLAAQDNTQVEDQPGEQEIDPVVADIVTDDVVVPDTPAPEIDAAVEPEIAEEQLPVGPEELPLVPVAEDDLPADETDEAMTVTNALPSDWSKEEELSYQNNLYQQMIEGNVLDEAESAAKRVVELAIETRGPTSTDFAKALTNLAIVQHRTQQYDAAQQNFESAIEIIEDNEDLLNGQLVNPLRGLGKSQMEAGRPDKANATYQRAIHVTHVNMGPHNLGQVDILESLSESYLRMGSLEDAKHMQDMIHALNERAYSQNTVEMVPSLMRRSQWQHANRFIHDERVTLRRVIKIIEAEGGKEDMRLVVPLTQLGRSYFFLDLSGTQPYGSNFLSTGEAHFKRALRIASADPDANWEVIAATSLALGDFYMVVDNPQHAYRIYQATWNELSKDEVRLPFRQEFMERYTELWFGPVAAYISPPNTGAPTGQEIPFLQGSITMSYDVSNRGRAANLQVVEAHPREFVEMQLLVQRELRRRIYRPEFQEGQPVNTSDQVFVHRFFYRQADLDAVQAAAAAVASEES